MVFAHMHISIFILGLMQYFSGGGGDGVGGDGGGDGGDNGGEDG